VGLWRQRRRYCLDACGTWLVARCLLVCSASVWEQSAKRPCKGRGPKVISVCTETGRGVGGAKEIKEYQDICPN
jgi:hypothetical protein